MLDDSTENTEISKLEFPRYYNELTGKNQTVAGKSWSTEWLLSEYTKCTDGLIGRMDGTIPMRKVDVYVKIGEILREEKKDLPPPASVIYLDKSARPIEWMVRALWPVLARQPGTSYSAGVVPKKPKDYFLNIDKKDWLGRMGVPEQYFEDPKPELINIDTIDREHITRIRALFSSIRIEEANLEEAWNHPTVLDGQHVMIVDEVPSSGQTLKIARMLLSLAIPEATFSGVYWATPAKIALNRGAEVQNTLQQKIEWVPVWYHGELSVGRGVGEIDQYWPEHAEKAGYPPSRYAKIGRYVLSTPLHDPETYKFVGDKKAQRIREDIEKMAEDLQGKILYRPSQDRPADEEQDWERLVDRIEAINGMSYTEWQEKRDSLKPKPT